MKKYTIKQSRWFVSMLALLISTGVHAEVFKGFPDTIVCNLGQGVHSPGQMVFYLEGRDKNGITYYKSLGPQALALKIGGDGVVRAETATVNDCINQSLRQLGEEGRTFHYTRRWSLRMIGTVANSRSLTRRAPKFRRIRTIRNDKETPE